MEGEGEGVRGVNVVLTVKDKLCKVMRLGVT